MKTRLILILTTIVLTILLVACAAPAQPQPGLWVWVERYCEEFYEKQHISETIEIKTGDTLVVVLCSNPTTGFRWSEDEQISDSSVLQPEIHESHGPESEPPPPPGTPGLESWRFKTLKPGTSTLYLEYSRPWEGGEKGEWTFTLDVVVE